MSKELVKALDKNFYLQKAENALRHAKDIVVTVDNAEKRKAQLQKVKTRKGEMEKKAEVWWRPDYEKYKNKKAIEKELVTIFDEAIVIWNKKIVDFDKEQAEIQKKEDEKARKVHEAEEKKLEEEKEKLKKSGASKEEIAEFEEEKQEEIVEKVNSTPVVKTVTIKGRKTIIAKVVDESKVKRELMSPDTKKINAFKKAEKKELDKQIDENGKIILDGIEYSHKITH